jgi:hypothetical protein
LWRFSRSWHHDWKSCSTISGKPRVYWSIELLLGIWCDRSLQLHYPCVVPGSN